MQFAMLFLLQNFPYTKIIPKRHGTQADFFDFFELFLTYFAAGYVYNVCFSMKCTKNSMRFVHIHQKKNQPFFLSFLSPVFYEQFP